MKIVVRTCTPAFLNDILDVVRIFEGGPVECLQDAEDGGCVLSHTEENGRERRVQITLQDGDRQYAFQKTGETSADPLIEKRLHKRLIKQCVFEVCRRRYQMAPPWGSLTGIRPTRLMYMAMDAGSSLLEAEKMLQDEEKSSLLREIIQTQTALNSQREGEIDLYCGIPFCVTRCAYCSFLSDVIGNGKQLVPYTDALIGEIRAVTDMISRRGLRVRTFYMGGGTPTSLPAPLLAKVLRALSPLMENCLEKTCEAGRPDTIDRGKLDILRGAGIDRISVNPQTMHDATLQRIGRRHNVEDTLRAYALARSAGFDDINMDLIAGLPGEDEEMFRGSCEKLLQLKPDSMTVHTLAIKHASLLHLWSAALPDGDMTARMVRYGRETARAMGMRPYYLYRQKYMAGNLENTAYALPGKESLYNIGMMEETADVLAVGAGAISKRVNTRTGKILRAPNVSDIGQYIDRVNEMAERKEALLDAEI